jgi:hypothetical protein
VEIPHPMIVLEKEGGMVHFLKKNGFKALETLFG